MLAAARLWMRRRRRLLVTLLVALAVGVGGLVVMWWTKFHPHEELAPPPEFATDVPYQVDGFAFSSDSAWLYYPGREGLIARSLRGENERRIPLPAKETNIAVAGNRRLFGLDRDTRDLFVADDSGDKLGAWVRLEIGNPRPISVVASTAGETVAITTREGEAQPHTPPFIKNHRLELFPVSNPTARRVLAVHHWDRGPPRFSEDGQFLVWSDQDNETLTVWRVADGELICVIPQSRKPMAYALSSDGRLVAYSTDIEHHCHVWSVPDNREVVSVTIPGVATALAFHPNGSLIVGCTHLGSSDLFDIRKGTLWIRDGVTGRTRWIRTNENGVLARVLISPDGRFVATLSGMSAYRLQVWRWDQLAP